VRVATAVPKPDQASQKTLNPIQFKGLRVNLKDFSCLELFR
jgi:hypothetical protein